MLLVDDNDISRDAFRMSLVREGFSVDAVASGFEALKQVEGRTFDLVLLDIHMPGMDGYQVLRSIREKSDASELPVIMVTARDRSEDVVRALESGANDYVTKPVDFPVALARIRTQLLLKQAVASLRESESQLKRLDEMRNDFISMVTHEIMSPISIIDGSINFFKDRLYGPFNDKYDSYIQIIAQNVARLLRLANDLVDLTKLSAGRFSIQKSRVDLKRVVITTCETLRPQAVSRGIDLRFPGAAQPDVWMEIDPIRMEQVVTNIVRNALKFSQSRIDVILEKDDADVLVVVEDDGPGIDADDLPNIFDKFYQGKQGKKVESGSGLGLAIVKGIVDAHGGCVRAETRPSGGARFTVSLPHPALES